MKSIVIAILTSLLLFAASAGTSMYLNQPVPSDEPDVAVEADMSPEQSLLPEVSETANQMPVGIRPDQGLTIEAVLQMSGAARHRKEKLDAYEQQLKGQSSCCSKT